MTGKVAAFIGQHTLLHHDKLYIVAVSGGADSVALLQVLLRLGYRIEAAHCNFHLRGEESQRDEQFVVELCQQAGVPLHRAHFDTRTFANLHHVGIEMAARDLRYHYFEQLRTDLGAEAVCVAHHQDDSVETILMNLIRGTGLRGLTGIKPRNGHIVRPLLCVSRKEIEAWLNDEQQPYVTDSTNLEADIVRNRIRLHVIPELLRCNPSAVNNILTTAHRLSEAQKVYDAAIEEYIGEKRLFYPPLERSVKALLQLPSPESVLFEWLSPAGFSPATIESVAQRLQQAETGRQWLSPTHQLVVHDGRLLLSERLPDRPSLRIPEPGTYVYEDQRLRLTVSDGATVSRDAAVATLDAAKVVFPLTLRPVQTGDRFHPFGMKGLSKLASDYLTDRKLPLSEKRRQLVLADREGRIVWLVGQRTDHRFCITPNTRTTLTVTLTPSITPNP